MLTKAFFDLHCVSQPVVAHSQTTAFNPQVKLCSFKSLLSAKRKSLPAFAHVVHTKGFTVECVRNQCRRTSNKELKGRPFLLLFVEATPKSAFTNYHDDINTMKLTGYSPNTTFDRTKLV